MRQPEMWSVVEKDFSRLENLEEELKVYANTTYDEYPPPGHPMLLEMDKAKLLSVDIETQGIDPTAGQIKMTGVTHKKGYGVVLSPFDPQLIDWMEDKEKIIVGQNYVLFDQKWYHYHGIETKATVHDTRHFGKLLNPDTPNDIYFLSGQYASPPMPGYWKTRLDYKENLGKVACMDVDAAIRIYEGQREELRRHGQLKLADDYVTPILQTALRMQLKGVRVDEQELDRLYGTEDAPGLLRQQLFLRRKLLPLWGGVGTEGQHQKVQEYLYDVLGLPVQKNRVSGKRTADSSSVETLIGKLQSNSRDVQHVSDEDQEKALQFLKLLQDLRERSKFLGYLKSYRLNRSGFLHPELNPLGTGTLRWTSKIPNCQQVPACKCKPKKCYGTNPNCRSARGLFIPDGDDWEVMAVDLKQAEVLGMLWHAEAWDVLDKILHRGLDAHFAVAQTILGRDPTQEERDSFKTTTFALLYGEMDKTTAARLVISVEEVQRAREQYFKMLPGVLDARRGFIRQAKEKGFVESAFGVRRYIRVERELGRAANQAANAPIQNIPPMVIGWKMLRLEQELPDPARIWLQVHDEVDLVYPKALRGQVVDCVRSIMNDPVREMPAAPLGMAGGFQFPVDIEVGDTWARVKPLES